MKADDDGPKGRDLSKALGLDAERLAEQLAFYEISDATRELLAQISDVCDPRLDEVIADFTRTCCASRSSRSCCAPSRAASPAGHAEGVLPAADARTARRRLRREPPARVGHAHQQIGLRPEW